LEKEVALENVPKGTNNFGRVNMEKCKTPCQKYENREQSSVSHLMPDAGATLLVNFEEKLEKCKVILYAGNAQRIT
jgi:hypothetical protein